MNPRGEKRNRSRISGKIKAILREFTPILEDVGIDEAFLDLSDIERPPEEVAQEIKKKIKEETGLTCSIGIAPNKLLAKIASDLDKPDGQGAPIPSAKELMCWYRIRNTDHQSIP